MIQNRTELRRSGVHGVALDCLEAAITAAEPARATRDAVTLEGDTLTIGAERFDLASYDDVLIVGGGKAAGGVTRALESILGDRITGGRIVTKHPEETERVQSVVGDHPLPSATNVEAMGSLRQLVTAADEDTLVLVGGIVPDDDTERLRAAGVAEIFGPGTATDELIEYIRENVPER